ncbi:SH3 domain-containing protein [Crassaminicella thermophila]|uniref:SH3 domain-containing protein n=1 Tax=Crassaminicella thermophila TaxID=2599308 RepID=A0A5C0SIU9_CRATE|nr:CAP domain-containing protein [Crassaminicella thermophila]QEK12879.1 SH3 domain-containing protein [Crassaminicella thermophila]
MKNTKKIFSLLIISVLLFTACAAPNQKPNVTPKSSSAFEKGKVEQIKIIKDNASCRSGQGTSYPELTKLPKGKVYNVIGELGDWYVIQTDDGKVGTVNPSDAKPQVTTEKTTQRQLAQNAAKLTPNENEMLRLINGERTKRGLNPLKLDMSITEVARLKSQDMIDNNYFSHNSPTYGSPFDMMKDFGIKYLTAGENIAGNPSVRDAHKSLMNSEGHRKNILNPNFTHIGIGIKEGGKYGKIYTQMFVGR